MPCTNHPCSLKNNHPCNLYCLNHWNTVLFFYWFYHLLVNVRHILAKKRFKYNSHYLWVNPLNATKISRYPLNAIKIFIFPSNHYLQFSFPWVSSPLKFVKLDWLTAWAFKSPFCYPFTAMSRWLGVGPLRSAVPPRQLWLGRAILPHVLALASSALAHSCCPAHTNSSTTCQHPSPASSSSWGTKMSARGGRKGASASPSPCRCGSV